MTVISFTAISLKNAFKIHLHLVRVISPPNLVTLNGLYEGCKGRSVSSNKSKGFLSEPASPKSSKSKRKGVERKTHYCRVYLGVLLVSVFFVVVV